MCAVLTRYNDLYCTFSYKPEHFTCKGTLGTGSKIRRHDKEKKQVIKHTSCKNALIHRSLGAVEVFFDKHHHFFTSTLDK